jgi:hypothetical protein
MSASGRVQPSNPIIGEGSDGGKRPATDDPMQTLTDGRGFTQMAGLLRSMAGHLPA